jgi:hypothetical protein
LFLDFKIFLDEFVPTLGVLKLLLPLLEELFLGFFIKDLMNDDP